jgi:hypothetical protein
VAVETLLLLAAAVQTKAILRFHVHYADQNKTNCIVNWTCLLHFALVCDFLEASLHFHVPFDFVANENKPNYSEDWTYS